MNGVTTAKFGGANSGITVNSVTVTDPDHATANITIAYNAPQQRVNVTVTTGTSMILGPRLFTVEVAALSVSPNSGERIADLRRGFNRRRLRERSDDGEVRRRLIQELP